MCQQVQVSEVCEFVVDRMWNVIQADAGTESSFMGNECLLKQKTKQKIKIKAVRRETRHEQKVVQHGTK